MDEVIDCVIVGGGPAGLTGAIYLARFLRSVMVIDAGASRASLIPTLHNYAGFPNSIKGHELLQRMTDQAERYGAVIRRGIVDRITSDAAGFAISAGETQLTSRTVFMATGTTDYRPPGLDTTTHDAAVADGLLRYCPVCDGFEARDQDIAVLGNSVHGATEARFLGHYSASVTLLPTRSIAIDAAQETALAGAGVTQVEDAVVRLDFNGGVVNVDLADGRRLIFDAIYAALGSLPSTRLAQELGLDINVDGYLPLGDHMRASTEGVWAAGDVVAGLNQVSVATGQAATAATSIHNWLLEKKI